MTPIDQAVYDGDIPNATSKEGAAAALRKILADFNPQPMDKHLLQAALAFLEGRN